MRICIPTVSEAGAEARISPHFGRAPYFTVVDTVSGSAQATPNPRVSPGECGSCDPAGTVVGLGVDAVVCRGLGAHALEKLSGAGVPVYLTEEWLVRAAVEAMAAQRLPPIASGHACHHAH